MSKRVLVLAASPRRDGNSTVLALRAAEGVEAAGGVADFVRLGGLRIGPCTACDVCRSGPDVGCIFDDDMQPLYGKLREADGVIFASPVYWFNMSAQLKLFIDRTYAMRVGDRHGLTGKDVGVILTYEDVDVFVSGGINALRCFQDICAYVGADLVGMVYGSAGKAGEVRGDEGLLGEAFDLGEKLVNHVSSG